MQMRSRPFWRRPLETRSLSMRASTEAAARTVARAAPLRCTPTAFSSTRSSPWDTVRLCPCLCCLQELQPAAASVLPNAPALPATHAAPVPLPNPALQPLLWPSSAPGCASTRMHASTCRGQCATCVRRVRACDASEHATQRRAHISAGRSFYESTQAKSPPCCVQANAKVMRSSMASLKR